MNGAYYNEHDPFAAAWLRGLIREGLIPAGDVDERDIQQVQPADLTGYQQCHFFAGIGGWAYALQIADAGELVCWTGSCPCQPYSAAGKGEGADDARNLWPHWFRLIRECRPPVLFGEQVEAAIRHGWLDTVSTNLEAEDYAFGACVLGAHSVRAPHIRQRVWFVADAANAYGWAGAGGSDGGAVGEHRFVGHSGGAGLSERERDGRVQRDQVGTHSREAAERGSYARGLANADHPERRPLALHRGHGCDRQDDGRAEAYGEPGTCGEVRGTVADAERERNADDGCGPVPTEAGRVQGAQRERERLWADVGERRDTPWSDLIWLPCRDGKARPTQPGIFPLAHGIPNRVGTLRGAGNAIVPQVAEAFIRSYREARLIA